VTTQGATDSLALSVHGPVGVLDLVVPAGAVATDVAEAYARQAGLRVVPILCTRLGAPLDPEVPLARAGVASGELLVATDQVVPAAHRTVADRRPPPRRATGADQARRVDPVAIALAVGAAVTAVVAGWCGATIDDGPARTITVALLVAATVIGVLPFGSWAAPRAAAAPAFAGAAVFALAYDPHPVRQPVLLGLCALAAAVAAAVGRSLSRFADEALAVWIVAGVMVFGLTGLTTLAGAPARLPWALLLVMALLAARFVPAYAVDVPDQYLIDLERLAVTAWSARETLGGKRGRSIVPQGAVSAVAERGTRIVTAAAAAILVTCLVAAPMLLTTATLPIDRIGARCLVGLTGAAVLLAARSYRHVAARTLLRLAGLACLVPVALVCLDLMDDSSRWTLVIASVLVAVVLVVVAVALGRGWRSAWWSRRAEVAEGLCGALALAALVVASGWFRELWEITSLWELGT
jgi:hypothetical protein